MVLQLIFSSIWMVWPEEWTFTSLITSLGLLVRIKQLLQLFLFNPLLHLVTPLWFSLAVALVLMLRTGGTFDRHRSCLMLVPFLKTGFGTFGNIVGNLASLAVAAS